MVIKALVAFSLSLMMTFLIFGCLKSYAMNETSVKMDDASLEKLVTEYADWRVNVPVADEPDRAHNIVGSPCIIRADSVIFLLDPYGKIKIEQNCPIDSGTPILFPFLLGWCDKGSTGNENKTLSEIITCISQSNKGIVTMEAWLNDTKIHTKIVDITIKNDGQGNTSLINGQQSEYYKHIYTKNPFNFTVTKNIHVACTALTDNDKTTKRSCGPALAECLCGIVSKLDPGSHQLRYHTSIKGQLGDMKVSGVDEKNDEVVYNFVVH